MKSKVFISVLIMFLIIGTASAEMYVKIGSSNVEKDTFFTDILRTMTLQGSFVRTYTATPGQVFPMTYQNCPFQGMNGNNEVASRITIVLNGVTVHDTGMVSVTPGVCYDPVTVQVTAPTTVGSYSGIIKDTPTWNPPASTTQSYSFGLTVQAAAPVATRIVLTPTSATILKGETYTIAANVYDQSGANMIVTPVWTTSNTAIATVDASGVVTGISAGTATITSTYGGLSATFVLTVTEPTATTITILPNINTISVGDTKQLTATVKDQRGVVMNVIPTWSSSSAAASVSPMGLVTGKGIANSVIITASYGGVSGSSTFNIYAPGIVIAPPSGFAAFLSAIWSFLRSIFPFLPM